MRKKFNDTVRLKNFSYASSRWYFVTICTEGRKCNLSKIDGCNVRLSKFGAIVEEEWLSIKERRPYVVLGPMAIMPNHVHGLLAIALTTDATDGGEERSIDKDPPTVRKLTPTSLSSVIGGFKSGATRRINDLRRMSGTRFWQQGFHDHIVRNEKEWEEIANYILYNPLNWHSDRDNPVGSPTSEEIEFWRRTMGL